MHYCIGTLLAEEMQGSREQFLLGGIAPDVNKNMHAPKSVSHFVVEGDDGKRYMNLAGFSAKYLQRGNEPFFFGYYYHLIADHIWTARIYDPRIRWLPQPEKELAQGKYYRDFRRLNGRLIDYYELELIDMKAEPIAMDEIDYRYLPAIVNELADDFAMKDEAKGQALEMLDFAEVIEVLEDTVQTLRACAVGGLVSY
ncbi:hypothetical protein [Paenibacillus glycinis]|uniref:Hydrolase n=1 Tax=Paenibacillus glycinis TaxID=2697035 RepID=A0ABW9XVH4_9BACL|nr:hypothetical protein [Paenibacillus glycinis]NBD26307.1 hypothetical protein [Paenibacillus glycinis]